MLRGMSIVSVHYPIGPGRSWTATWVPYGGTLQVHFLPIAKWITTFRAARASWVEMMIVAGLQDLTTDVTLAIGALYSKLLLVILLAVRHAVFSHVFSVENSIAAMTLEAPDMPLTIERDQCLTFPQLVSTAGTSTRVSVSAAFGTGTIADRCGGLANRDTNASMTQRLTLNKGYFCSLSQQRLPASLAMETIWVKRVLLAGCHHITLHVLPATGTTCTPALPIILCAVVGTLACEETTLR